MTNREKLIELLTEKDGKVGYTMIRNLLSISPFDDYYCLNDTRCEDAHCNCSICAAKWLNMEAKE